MSKAKPADKTKAALKEGGKKGQDLSGLEAMGGMAFFTICLETPEDNWDLMNLVLQGLNAPVDEAEEERKGGAGHLGKMLLSAGDNALIMLCHIPKALQEAKGMTPKEWMEEMIKLVDGATIVKAEEEIVTAVANADPTNERFPLKLRDIASGSSFAYLRKKGFMADEDEDDSYEPECDIEW